MVHRIEFPMDKKPIAVQLTVHINNLLNTYPNSKKVIIQEFKDVLIKGDEPYSGYVKRIVHHYGRRNLKKWFKDIYGWEFEKQTKVS